MLERDLPLIEWGDEYQRYRRVYREIFRSSSHNRSRLWVAEMAGVGLVGQVFLTINPINAHKLVPPKSLLLSSFRVKQEYRGMGIGSSLLNTCEACARELHIEFLWLNCSKHNEKAQAFYRDHGFEIFRLDPGDWQYIDHLGEIRREIDPAWSMSKMIR